jgi:hypothetical protein
VHFAAQRNHLSLTVVSLSVLETFRAELRGFDVSGRTIHFTPAKPLPAGLVKRIVQARARENEAAARTKPRRTAPAKDHLPRLRRRQPRPLTAAEAEALDEENRGNR